MTPITRRQALLAGAALPLAAAAGTRPALAAAGMQGPSFAQVNRFALGEFEVTTLLAGTRKVDAPQGIFGMNVSAEEFAAVSARNFLPTDAAQFFFTPTLVNTGSSLVLFDTGLNGAGITDALARAGHTPDQVDTVVITHMHGDHIGGLMTEGAPTFANASYVTGQVEFDAWNAMDNDGFKANVLPLADRMSFIGDGGVVTGGITGMAAFGHSPGHMVYRIESQGKLLTLIADTANHPIWSLERPDWEVRFDADKAAAAATRRAVFGMLADERSAFVGYHMPFPAVGYVETREDGFRWVPAGYQLML